MSTLLQRYPYVVSLLCELYNKYECVLRFVCWCHVCIFVAVFLAAVVGNKFGIRRAYITVLDKIFRFADDNTVLENDAEHVDEDDHFAEDNGLVLSPECPRVPRQSTEDNFHFDNILPYISAGMKAIVDDTVLKTMAPETLSKWNMLSRTKKRFPKAAKSVTMLWIVGVLFRYVFLLPIRIIIFVLSLSNLILCTFMVGLLPDGELKKKCNAIALCWSFDFVANALSVVARFHNQKYIPAHGIAVANHTSPIDSMILATDRCYDMMGQKSTGVLGLFMRALSKSSTHIWFDRGQSKDRKIALRILEEHAKDESLPPLIIYPEGICVNNTAVMLFRKGVFQLNTDIYPIAIKFDPKYGDAFWWQDGFFVYLLSMMSSWAIVCDVWYLPPMRRGNSESTSDFAKRVKSAIAKCGGMNELDWDGNVKFSNVLSDSNEKEKSWKRKQQIEFAKSLNNGKISN